VVTHDAESNGPLAELPYNAVRRVLESAGRDGGAVKPGYVEFCGSFEPQKGALEDQENASRPPSPRDGTMKPALAWFPLVLGMARSPAGSCPGTNV
jgi:hypothetical protein